MIDRKRLPSGRRKLEREEDLVVLSLGAGVQSSTIALMCAAGLVKPMPDCAIFADTGAEPDGVYAYLGYLEKLLPFSVYRVQKGDGIKNGLIRATKGKRFASIPFFTESPVGKGRGMLKRQCTKEYKIEPINKKVRELLGVGSGRRVKKGTKVVQYIGISTDEVGRMKPSRVPYIEHRWPLLELNMSRMDCLAWINKHGYKKPGKSACTFCPYHDNALWREMKLNDPKSFAEAVEIDALVRNGVRGSKEKIFVHSSLKPLSEVDFRNASESGQGMFFEDECEGMCGV